MYIRLSDMQQLKENLTLQANETYAAYLSVKEQNKEAEAILQNITATLPKQHKDINNNPRNTTSAGQHSEEDNKITLDTQLIQVYTSLTLKGQNTRHVDYLISLTGMPNYQLNMHSILVRAF